MRPLSNVAGRPEATSRHVRGDYRLEELEGVTHWVPETAAGRLGELVTAHVRSAG